MSLNRIRVLVGSLLLGASLFAAVPAASAQQAGLVNVSVGNVNILNHVPIGIAEQVAASVCGVSVGPVAALAANVVQTSTTRTVCNTSNGPVKVSPVA